MNSDASGSVYSLGHVPDDELHQGARRLVGRSNQLLAALLAHLGEVEARGIHRESSCASLYTYCVYELRLSEDAAFRRARAARLARQFPILLEQIAAGELHLTGLLLLGPHLTEQNHRELLALARHRTKREILRLIRRIDPKPDVPESVEPLGPAPVGVPLLKDGPSWEEFVESLCPPARELPPGENPKNWTTPHAPDDDSDVLGQEPGVPRPASAPPEATRSNADATQPNRAEPNLASASAGSNEPRAEPFPARAPERFKVQFTAGQEYVDLLEQAKDLMSHVLPSGALEPLHLQAMRLLVAELKKRRCAESASPRPSKEHPLRRGDSAVDAPNHATEARRRANQPNPPRRANQPNPPRQRRQVTAAVRRVVWSRDDAQCTYVDQRGIRCSETRFLELHHLDPLARGGADTTDNLTLRCRSHNVLAAEQDFGRDFMQERRQLDREPRASEWSTTGPMRTGVG